MIPFSKTDEGANAEENENIPIANSPAPNGPSSTLQVDQNKDKVMSVIADRIYPDPMPPSQAQIDIIRFTWERVTEIHLPTDSQNVSPSHAFGLAFYDALFELDGSLKSLFSDIFLQARALAGMVAYIARTPKVTGSKIGIKISDMSKEEEKEMSIREINALKRREYATEDFQTLIMYASRSRTQEDSDVDIMLLKLREVGARHYFYDVKSSHLALIGPAVLQALKARLDREFLPEVADAWTRAFAFASYHMTTGLKAQENWEVGKKKAANNKKMNLPNKSNCLIQ